MPFKPTQMRAYNGYDTKKASEDAANIGDYGESLTVQSMAEDADINVLMKRYGITGKMPENPRIPTYGDFSEITDYRSALEAVRNAHENFMEIPADVRAKFNNDPQQFLEYTTNPANIEGMVALGLAKPKTPPPGATTNAPPKPDTQTTPPATPASPTVTPPPKA